MSKKYIIINGIKFPNNAFFGNLNSNEFDTFQDNIWAFESRVPDWMLKQLKDNFDPSVYNQDFESFYGKWNKFDKNSKRNLIDLISVYDDGKIDLTGDLDSAGQLDSTGAATEDENPSGIILNMNQTLDEELDRLEENEEIQNLGDLDSVGLNFQEIKDELDSLDSSFEVNLTEITQVLDGLGIKTVINGNNITGVTYESIVDPNSTSLEDDVKALDDKWNDIPQNDIENFTDKLENYTSPEIPGNNFGQDLRNLQESYAILNEEVSINDRLVEQNEKFNDFISKVELNQDLSYTNPITSSTQKDDGEIDEIDENSSVTETIEYAKRNLIDEDDTSVARLDEEGNLVAEKESFFVSNSSQSTDGNGDGGDSAMLGGDGDTGDDGSDIQSIIELKPELNKREITYKSESGEDNVVNITGKLTYLNYDPETNELIYTNEDSEEFFAEIKGELTSIEYREEDAKIGEFSYKKKFLDYYGEEYIDPTQYLEYIESDDSDPNNIKNPDGSWSIELPQSFTVAESDIQSSINADDWYEQKSFPWIWTNYYGSDSSKAYKELYYQSSSESGIQVVLNNKDSNVGLNPSPHMLIANGNPDLNDPNFNFNFNVRISDWVFDWDSTIDVDNPTEDFTINWITSEEYNSKPIGGPYDLLTYPMGSGGNLNGMVYYFPETKEYSLAADMKNSIPYIFSPPLKPESHHPTFLFRLDQVPLYKDGNSYQTESGMGIFDNIFISQGAYKNLFYEYSENGQIEEKTEVPTIDWDALYNTFSYFEIKQDVRYDEDDDEYQERYYIEPISFHTTGELVFAQSINHINNEIETGEIYKEFIFQNLDSLLNTGIDQFDYLTTTEAFRTEESTNESLYPYTKMEPKNIRLDSFTWGRQQDFNTRIEEMRKQRNKEMRESESSFVEFIPATPLSLEDLVGTAQAPNIQRGVWPWANSEDSRIKKIYDSKISGSEKSYVKEFIFRESTKNDYLYKLHYPFKTLVFINENDVPQIVKVRENLTSIFTPMLKSKRQQLDDDERQKNKTTDQLFPDTVEGFTNLSKTEKFDRRYASRYHNIPYKIIGVGTEDVDMPANSNYHDLTTELDKSYRMTEISSNGIIPASVDNSERVMYYVNESHRVYKINLDSSSSITELRKTVDNDLYFIHEKVPHEEYGDLFWLFDENITTQSFEDQLNSFDWQTAAGSTDIEKQNEYKPNFLKFNTIVKDYVPKVTIPSSNHSIEYDEWVFDEAQRIDEDGGNPNEFMDQVTPEDYLQLLREASNPPGTSALQQELLYRDLITVVYEESGGDEVYTSQEEWMQAFISQEDIVRYYESGEMALFPLSDEQKTIVRIDGKNQNLEKILKVRTSNNLWNNIYPFSYKLESDSEGELIYSELGVSIESLVDEEQKCSVTYHISENNTDKDRWKFKADETSLDVSTTIIPPKYNSEIFDLETMSFVTVYSSLNDRVLVKGEISRHLKIPDDPLLDLSSMSVERIDFEIPSVKDFVESNLYVFSGVASDVRSRFTLEQEVIADPNDAENPYKFLKIGSEQKDSDYVKPSYPVKQDYKIYRNSNSEQEIDLQFRNHFIDLRAHDEEGYETGQNFKGVLGDGLYDGQEIKIWITNTGNNNTYSKLEFDIKDPFDDYFDFYDADLFDYPLYSSANPSDSSRIRRYNLEYKAGERYRLPLGYVSSGRGMDDSFEISEDIGNYMGNMSVFDISRKNISRFRTKFFHEDQHLELSDDPEMQTDNYVDDSIQYFQKVVSEDTRTDVPIKGKGLTAIIRYRNYYQLKDVNVSLENLNRFEDINLPRSLESSVGMDNVIGRPVVKVINSLIPTHSSDGNVSDFFTEFPSHEDYYYRVTQPEIVKFKVTSTSRWEEKLYKLSDDEHYMHLPLRQYSNYLTPEDENYQKYMKDVKIRRRGKSIWDRANSEGNITSTEELPGENVYGKGVWSGDYWKSYYTSFPSKIDIEDREDRATQWVGDNNILWKYEHVDLKGVEEKPLAKDYIHLPEILPDGRIDDVNDTISELTSGDEGIHEYPILEPLTFPLFLGSDSMAEYKNDLLKNTTIDKLIKSGKYQWGENDFGFDYPRPRTPIYSYRYGDKSTIMHRDPDIEYYFRRNRYSHPDFSSPPTSISMEGLPDISVRNFAEDIEFPNHKFLETYNLNIPNYSRFTKIKELTNKTTYHHIFYSDTWHEGNSANYTQYLDQPSAPSDILEVYGQGQNCSEWINRAKDGLVHVDYERSDKFYRKHASIFKQKKYKETLGSLNEYYYSGNCGESFRMGDAGNFNLYNVDKDTFDTFEEKYSSRIGPDAPKNVATQNAKNDFLINWPNETTGLNNLEESIIPSGEGYKPWDIDRDSNRHNYVKYSDTYDRFDSIYITEVIGSSTSLQKRKSKIDMPNEIIDDLDAYWARTYRKIQWTYDNEEDWREGCNLITGYKVIDSYEDDGNYIMSKGVRRFTNSNTTLWESQRWINYIGFQPTKNYNTEDYLDDNFIPGTNLYQDFFPFSKSKMLDWHYNAVSSDTRLKVIAHPIHNSHDFMLSGLNLDNGSANFDSDGKRVDLINARDLFSLYTHGGGSLTSSTAASYFGGGHSGTSTNNNLSTNFHSHPWWKHRVKKEPLFSSHEDKIDFFEKLASSLNDYYHDKLPLPSYCFNFHDRKYRGEFSTFDFWYNFPYYRNFQEKNDENEFVEVNGIADHGKIIDSQRHYHQLNRSHHSGISHRNISSGIIYLDKRISNCGSMFFQSNQVITNEKPDYTPILVDELFNKEDFIIGNGHDLSNIRFSTLKKHINANPDLYESLAEASDDVNHVKDAICFHVDDNDIIIGVYKPKFYHAIGGEESSFSNHILDFSEFKDKLRTGDSIILHYAKKVRPENFLESEYSKNEESISKVDYDEIIKRYSQGILGINLNINYTRSPESKLIFDLTNPDDEDVEINAIKSYGWYAPGQKFQACRHNTVVSEQGEHWLIGSFDHEGLWHCGLSSGNNRFVDWRVPLYIVPTPALEDVFEDQRKTHLSIDYSEGVKNPVQNPLSSDDERNVYNIIDPNVDMSIFKIDTDISILSDEENPNGLPNKIVAFNNNVTIHQPLIKRPGTGIIVRSGGAPELFQGHQDSPFPSNNEQISDNFYFERTRKVVPETVENEQFDEDQRTKLRKMSNWQWGLFEFENTGEWVHEEVKTSECEYYSVVKPKYIDVSPLMYKCIWSENQGAWILHGGSHSDTFTTFDN